MTKEHDPLNLRNIFKLGPSGEDHWVALRCGIGVFLPLVFLLVIDRLDLAIFAVFGAFVNVYGRVPGHLNRLIAQLKTGALFWILILIAWFASTYWIEHGTTRGLWMLVALTSVVAGVCTYLTSILRVRPAGSLFHIFAFAAIASAPNLPSVSDSMFTTTCTIMLALFVGLAGRLLPSRRTEWQVSPVKPFTPELQKAFAIESALYFVAAAAAGSLATLLSPIFQTSHNYWAMVAAVVPLVGKTMRHRLARGVHRILGTLVGLVLMALIVAINPGAVVTILIIGLMQFTAEMFIARNYFFAQIFVTPLALVGTGLSSGTTDGLVYDRLVETVIGAIVGILTMVVGSMIGNAIRRRLSANAASSVN